jgi:uncharacterized membrane-anchored protein
MTLTLPVRIMAAAGVLAAMLVGLVVHESSARDHGREVRLPMEAIDPQDLLSGHYAILQMNQAIPAGAPCPPGTESGDAMITGPRRPGEWIALTPTPTGDRVAGAGHSRAAAAKFGPVQVQGTARCMAVQLAAGETATRTGSIWLDLGIRGFHANQKEAQALETSMAQRGNDSFAVVSVGEDGKARLKGVIVAGKRHDLDWN